MPISAKKAVTSALASKAAVKKPVVLRTLPRLTLWADANFMGTRLRFRGNLGVRDLRVLSFNDVLSSFNLEGRRETTLVLFQDINYKGSRRVFRGAQAVALLSDFNDLTSSFVVSLRRLSTSQINRIQRLGAAPFGFAEVLPDGVVARKGKKVKK
ncbi:hypothetical protein MJA45_27790 [Paenibacillus aurantius]|uniref:Uncharacterized protein n=1 Tax=Paenibacillus aurantius TaxID=2918900 RepID=A0AA96LG53_9BACL|nr:hypothetical protein [Paenibacillus aurantius]WNQ11356.1 hypothetical protein MJA45_27790 [Paenibacillus aurantius]